MTSRPTKANTAFIQLVKVPIKKVSLADKYVRISPNTPQCRAPLSKAKSDPNVRGNNTRISFSTAHHQREVSAPMTQSQKRSKL
jgi:hypothetical protein